MEQEIRLIRYAETDSTNARAKDYISNENGNIPALFIAREQTAGRGRMGRSFYSPKDTGLYATLLFEAPKQEERLLSLTSLAAVALCEAIDETLGVHTEIKWVNDLYLNGKKVAGILAESFVFGGSRYVALGFGVNLCTSHFPEDISERAGALTDMSVSEETADALALLCSKNLLSFLSLKDFSSPMSRYRARSCVIGRRISFTECEEQKEALALDVTELGALRVRLEDGGERLLSTGEISVFLK